MSHHLMRDSVLTGHLGLLLEVDEHPIDDVDLAPNGQWPTLA